MRHQSARLYAEDRRFKFWEGLSQWKFLILVCPLNRLIRTLLLVINKMHSYNLGNRYNDATISTASFFPLEILYYCVLLSDSLLCFFKQGLELINRIGFVDDWLIFYAFGPLPKPNWCKSLGLVEGAGGNIDNQIG